MSSLSSPSSILLIAGLALIAVGLVGGGIEVKEIKIPQLSTLPRAGSFLIGCILTAWVVVHDLGNTRDEFANRRDDLGTAITNHLIDIRDVKYDLQRLGIYFGPINNVPDGMYFQAVANFQQSKNIGPDGLVDAATLEKLKEALAQLPPPPDLAATPSTPTQPASAPPQPAPSPKQTPGPPTRAEIQPVSFCKIQPGHKARPSPGVNCTAAGTADEVEICASTSLCELDWHLYSVYQVRKASLDKNQQGKLAKDEDPWVKKRGDCKSDATCIASAYRSRIADLAQ